MAPFSSDRLKRTAPASGQTLPLVVAFMFTILLFAGLVIDFGNAYRVQKALQASADAAAAAGAGQLTMVYPPVSANATAAAQKYGSQSGGVICTTRPRTTLYAPDCPSSSRTPRSRDASPKQPLGVPAPSRSSKR